MDIVNASKCEYCFLHKTVLKGREVEALFFFFFSPTFKLFSVFSSRGFYVCVFAVAVNFLCVFISSLFFIFFSLSCFFFFFFFFFHCVFCCCCFLDTCTFHMDCVGQCRGPNPRSGLTKADLQDWPKLTAWVDQSYVQDCKAWELTSKVVLTASCCMTALFAECMTAEMSAVFAFLHRPACQIWTVATQAMTADVGYCYLTLLPQRPFVVFVVVIVVVPLLRLWHVETTGYSVWTPLC